MTDLKSKAREVYDRGFCVIDSIWSPADRDLAERAMADCWEKRGRPSLAGFGLSIHPLLEFLPEMTPLFDKPVLLDALAMVLRDEPFLAHTGARLSNEESADAIGWHEHYAWDKSRLPGREKIERVLFACYTRGSSPEVGSLVVYPRRYDEPMQVAPAGLHDHWPGQIAVAAPPGSCVIFDTALWHTAHRGTKPGFRYLWGTHIQGKSNPMPHPEDNTSKRPEIEEFTAKSPRLRSFIRDR
ncbi:MAG: hypothetical protein K8S99_07600 [Planctomycetes bacterium]|nr:hypothetical protein [Planctomycetota bacterium]